MARKGKQKKNNDSLPSVTETLRDFARRLAPLVASGLITAVTARKLIQSHPTAEMGTQTISGSVNIRSEMLSETQLPELVLQPVAFLAPLQDPSERVLEHL